MFEIRVVENCPYTRASHGVVHIPHNVLGQLAGAVWDDLEWLCLLKGTRSKDGFNINVTHVEVPAQYRNSGICGLEEDAAIDPTVVGVVHSHHKMGAFFSGIDIATFNTRFPLSIVIAQPKKWGLNNLAETFGFEYKAEARVVLPCGDIGVVPYIVVPNPVPLHWPTVRHATIAADKRGLGDCGQAVEKKDGKLTSYHTACKETRAVLPQTYFGQDEKTILDQVAKVGRIHITKPQVFINGSDGWGDEYWRGLSKKERKRLRRLQHPQALDLSQTDEKTERIVKEAWEGADAILRKRQCIHCKMTKFDYGRGQNWATFVQFFLDGTGVCRECDSRGCR